MLGFSDKIAGTLRLASWTCSQDHFTSRQCPPESVSIFWARFSFHRSYPLFYPLSSPICKVFADLCAAFFPLLPAVERQVIIGGFRPGSPCLNYGPMSYLWRLWHAGGRWCSPWFGVLLRKEVLGNIPTNAVLPKSHYVVACLFHSPLQGSKLPGNVGGKPAKKGVRHSSKWPGLEETLALRPWPPSPLVPRFLERFLRQRFPGTQTL